MADTSQESEVVLASLAANRYGYGAWPGDVQAIATEGAVNWLSKQLGMSANDPNYARQIGRPLYRNLQIPYYTSSDKSPTGLSEGRKLKASNYTQLQKAVTSMVMTPVRSAYSFHERMIRFWLNLFRVSSSDYALQPLILDFEDQIIRRFYNGTYGQLLIAAFHHPALLIIHQNIASTGRYSRAGRNRKELLIESLAKLLLYQLTLGGTHQDTAGSVLGVANSLSGWSVKPIEKDGQNYWQFDFKEELHEPGTRNLFGKSYREAGREQVEHILLDLANNPATAINLAFQLASHIFGDRPPKDLVDDMAVAYMNSGGHLQSLMLAMIKHPLGWELPAYRKLKNPQDLVYSSYRSLTNFRDVSDVKASTLLSDLERLGQPYLSYREGSDATDYDANWLLPDLLYERLEWCRNFAHLNGVITNGPMLVHQLADIWGPLLSQDLVGTVQNIQDGNKALSMAMLSPWFQYR